MKRSSQVVDESPGSIIAGGRGAGSQPTGGTSLRGGGDSHGAKKASQSATDGDGGSGEQVNERRNPSAICGAATYI